MVGAAVGGVNGIARAANVVIVRLPVSWRSHGPQMSVSTIMDALRQVLFDIRSGKRQGKAVVNMSWGKRFNYERITVFALVTVAETISSILGVRNRAWPNKYIIRLFRSLIEAG